MTIVVGGVVENDGKYLLVQENKSKCYGKWNLPAGRLQVNENIMKGAIREVREETGCDVELTGICQIGNRVMENDVFLSMIFTTKIVAENIIFDSSEVLDVKWFSYDEIVGMKDELRSPELVLGSIDNCRNNIVASLEMIQLIK